MKKLLTLAAAALTLGLGGALMAQQIGSVSNGYIEETDLLRPGAIIQTITMSNRGQNAVTCRKACDGNSGCNAYSYVQTAANRKPVCHLRMTALPNRARRNHGYANVVSGTKLTYLPSVLKMTPYPGRAVQGARTIKTFPVRNEDPVACADACFRDGTCGSFTYIPDGANPAKRGAMCTLHNPGGNLSSNSQSGFLSGSKKRMAVTAKDRTGTTERDPRINVPVKPRDKPTLSPLRGSEIEIPRQELKLPDATPGDDDDAGDAPEGFPGEMLDPPE